jgi:hypothetical protein
MATANRAGRRRRVQDEHGRIAVTVADVLFVLTAYVVILAVWSVMHEFGLNDSGTDTAVAIAGFIAIGGFGRWGDASALHRAAYLVGTVLIVVAPMAALVVLPESHRSSWWPSVLVELGASLTVLAGFAAITHLRSFAPPYEMFGPSDPGITVSRHWTAAERRDLLAPSDERVLRSRARWYLTTVNWAIAVLGPIEVVGVAGNREWIGVAVGIPMVLVALWCGIRGPGIRLAVDAEMVTVHNVWRTYRVPWDAVTGIIPADGETNLTLVLTGGRVVPVSNWSGGLRPRFREDRRLRPLLDLLGPEAR